MIKIRSYFILDRGFESYSLRHLLTPIGRSIQIDSLDMAENRP